MTAIWIVVGALAGAAIAAFLPRRALPVVVGVALVVVLVGAAVVFIAGPHAVLLGAVAVAAGLTVTGARRYLVT